MEKLQLAIASFLQDCGMWPEQASSWAFKIGMVLSWILIASPLLAAAMLVRYLLNH